MHENNTEKVMIILADAGIWLRIIIDPILILIGWTGNILLFLTMRSSLYCRTNFSVYSRAIAAIDNLVICGSFLMWLEAARLIDMNDSTKCSVPLGIIFSSSMQSNWILLAANVDVLITIMKPEISRRFLTKTMAKIMVSLIILSIIAVIIQWPFISH
ncbi:hypothetical protein ACOME3_001455 [Neoechinorhynchus agilis]